MAREKFSAHCQNCGGRLRAERFRCPDCALVLEGEIELPRLARLEPDDRKFIELFVLSAGSLKEVGRVLKLSYPTVRQQLDGVIERLRQLDGDLQERRMEIIRELEEKRIDAKEAARRLAAL